MSIPLNVNGSIFNYPEVGDSNWGNDATQWAKAITLGTLQKAGGLFQLTADVNFGTDFGLISNYFKSRTTNISDAGTLRLARPDLITWRNQANNGNNTLGVDSSNQLLFNGAPIASSITVNDTATINLTLLANILSADLVPGSLPVSNPNHIILTPSNMLGFRKSKRTHFIYEDFDIVKKTTLTEPGSSLQTLVSFANTNWKGGTYNSAGPDGYAGPKGSGSGHPGVIELVSGDSGATGSVSTWINLGDHSSDGYFQPYLVSEIYSLECVMKAKDTTAVQFMFGLSDNATPALSQNQVAFFKNTVTDNTVHAICKNNNTATNVDTNIDPLTKWTNYKIIQETLGTFDFYINDVLKNSVSTNVPSTKLLAAYFSVESTTNGGSPKGIEIDYFSLETRDLGNRFE